MDDDKRLAILKLTREASKPLTQSKNGSSPTGGWAGRELLSELMASAKPNASPRLLLVDDEEMYLEYLSRRLINRGYDVTTCLSGEEALEKAGCHTFDVIVLDVLLPGIDGIETLREIKRLTPLAEVIMLTGHASLESGIEGMKLGAYDYLRKPCDTADLVAAINDAYGKKQSQEQRIQETLERYNVQENGGS